MPYQQIVDYLNRAGRTNYKHTTKTTRNHIKARCNEGYTLEDFKAMVDSRWKAWESDLKMCQYLQPSTLFGLKFENYLQEHKPAAQRTEQRGWKYKSCGAQKNHTGIMCLKCRKEGR